MRGRNYHDSQPVRRKEPNWVFMLADLNPISMFSRGISRPCLAYSCKTTYWIYIYTYMHACTYTCIQIKKSSKRITTSAKATTPMTFLHSTQGDQSLLHPPSLPEHLAYCLQKVPFPTWVDRSRPVSPRLMLQDYWWYWGKPPSSLMTTVLILL